MAKRRMSAAARARIGEAQRKRWAAFRAGNGKPMKRGKSMKRSAVSSDNPYLRMSIAEFVEAKQQMDAAWKEARRVLR